MDNAVCFRVDLLVCHSMMNEYWLGSALFVFKAFYFPRNIVLKRYNSITETVMVFFFSNLLIQKTNLLLLSMYCLVNLFDSIIWILRICNWKIRRYIEHFNDTDFLYFTGMTLNRHGNCKLSEHVLEYRISKKELFNFKQ